MLLRYSIMQHKYLDEKFLQNRPPAFNRNSKAQPFPAEYWWSEPVTIRLMRNIDMSTLMLPAATMTTMTNTTPIAVAQPKADPVKGTLISNNNNNSGSNKQGRLSFYK